MKLCELLSRSGIPCPKGREDIEVTKIVTDSRKISSGCMFVCIRGQRRDGHDFINFASEAGASVIVAEQVRGDCVGGAAIVTVENTRRASALLYNAWYGSPSERVKVIGVTGTNGKTSTAFITGSLLRAAGHSAGVIGTLGVFGDQLEKIDSEAPEPCASMTTPDPDELYRILDLFARQGIEYAVMEVSSHALSLHKTDGITFDTAVFTNLTHDHLDFHGSMEDYYNAKKRLFLSCGKAVINTDCSYGERLLGELSGIDKKIELFTSSRGGKGDFCSLYEDFRGSEGVSFGLSALGIKAETMVGTPMGFAVSNSLLALGAAALATGGVNQEKIALMAKALESFSGVPGRMERAYADGDICVYIDYAHTPDALENILLGAREMRRAGERIVLLFGCGGRRDRSKRAEMGRIASRLSDAVIVSSDNPRDEDPRQIISDVLKGIDKEKPHKVIENRREAIEYAVATARRGDIILLCGKGHEKYEINAEGKRPFDERDIVVKAAERRRMIAEGKKRR